MVFEYPGLALGETRIIPLGFAPVDPPPSSQMMKTALFANTDEPVIAGRLFFSQVSPPAMLSVMTWTQLFWKPRSPCMSSHRFGVMKLYLATAGGLAARSVASWVNGTTLLVHVE